MPDDATRKVRMAAFLDKGDRMVIATWSKQTVPAKGEFFLTLTREQFESLNTVVVMLNHKPYPL